MDTNWTLTKAFAEEVVGVGVDGELSVPCWHTNVQSGYFLIIRTEKNATSVF